MKVDQKAVYSSERVNIVFLLILCGKATSGLIEYTPWRRT
jgi:hypothetical protein